MKLTYGVQTVEAIFGRRVIKSSAVGATNAAEIRWLTNQLVSLSNPWHKTGWVYMIDISQMAPAAPEVSAELVTLHKKLTISGCKGMAFVEGTAFFLAAQARQHQKQAHTIIQEGHFRTEAEALKWIDTILR